MENTLTDKIANLEKRVVALEKKVQEHPKEIDDINLLQLKFISSI